jgi:hypothetical protein
MPISSEEDSERQRIDKHLVAIMAVLELKPRMSAAKYVATLNAVMDVLIDILAVLPAELCKSMLAQVLHEMPIAVTKAHAELKQKNECIQITRQPYVVGDNPIDKDKAKAIRQMLVDDFDDDDGMAFVVFFGAVEWVMAMVPNYQTQIADMKARLPRAVAERRVEIGRDKPN